MDKTLIRDEIVRQFGDGEVRVYVADEEVVLVKWKRLSATIGWRSGPVRVSIADKDEQPTDVLENRFSNEVMPSNLTESQIVETMVKTMKEYDRLKVGSDGSESTRSVTEG